MVSNPMNYVHARHRHIYSHDQNCTLGLQRLKTICLIISTQVCRSFSFVVVVLISIMATIQQLDQPFAIVVSFPCLHRDLQLPRHRGEGEFISLFILQFSSSFSRFKSAYVSFNISLLPALALSSLVSSNMYLWFILHSISAYSSSTLTFKVKHVYDSFLH